MDTRLRLLWLCKARYMNHDVIADRYARLFELPQGMGEGAEVSAVCLEYRWRDTAEVSGDLQGRWHTVNLPRTLLIGWLLQLVGRVKSFRPSCVIASSDCLSIVVGAFLARVSGAAFVADLYDDYSAFGLARLPGLRWLYRRALARADGISVVSKTLGQAIEKQYPGKPVLVLESTIDADCFGPGDQPESRVRLGLEKVAGKRLVGLCGGLNALHGADVVFSAIPEVVAQRDDVVFVVAGKEVAECPLPQGDNVLYLGMLPYEQMSFFYSAMDVVIVALSDSTFGYYAFPQKAYEVIACRVPAVAADVGALGMLFEGLPGVCYRPDSPGDLAGKVLWQLDNAAVLDVEVPTWRGQGGRLLGFVGEVTGTDQRIPGSPPARG